MKNYFKHFILIAVIFVASSAQAMTLKEMIKTFVDTSPTIQAANAKKKAAEHEAKAAFSSFFPTIDLTANKLDQTGPSNSDLFESVMPDITTYSVGLEGSLPIYVGGARWNNWKAKKLSSKLAEANFYTSKNQSLAAVVRAVLQWLAARDQLQVLKGSEKIQKNYVSITRRRQKRGASLAFELSQAQADLFSYAPRIELLQREMLDKEKELQAALGLDEPPKITIDWPSVLNKPPQDVKTSLKQANEIRPDLLATQLQKNLSETAKSLSLSEDLPSLALFANQTYKNTEMSGITDDENKSTAFGVTLTVPLFSGLSSLHKRRAGNENIFAAEKQLRMKQLSVETEIVQAHQAVETSARQLEQTDQWRSKAREAMRLGDKSYKVGRLSSVQWVQLQRGKETAEINYTQAQLGHHFAVLQWSLALGVDLEPFYMKHAK